MIHFWKDRHFLKADVRLLILSCCAFTLASLSTRASAQEGWIKQNSGTTFELYDIYFVDELRGWAVGDPGNGTSAYVIVHTTNGGVSWSIQSQGGPNLWEVHFVDSLVGWAAGAVGTILHTIDGGNTWSPQITNDPHNLFGLCFVDANTGWACGDWYTMLHTTNGGGTWVQQSIGSRRSLEDVFFLDSMMGWASGNPGDIFRTTNGGSTWDLQFSTDPRIDSPYFVNETTGWACGSYGTILHTANSGLSWLTQASGTSQHLRGVYFADSSTGWIVGDSGTVLHTTNGGNAWLHQPSGTTENLHDFFFVDDLTAWISGRNGTILHTMTGGNPLPWPVAVEIEVDSLLQIIPAEGDTFTYSMTFTNVTMETQVIDWWTKVIRPSGDPIDPLAGPQILILAPLESRVIDTTLLPIPWNAPSGQHQLICFVGRYLSDTLDTDTTFVFKQPSNPPSEGLILYFPFNGSALDGSGHENHGTVSGATLTTDRFGNSNSAYYFDGDDHIDYPVLWEFPPNELSSAQWVHADQTTGPLSIVYHGDNGEVGMGMTNGSAEASVHLNDGLWYFLYTPIKSQGWNHLAMTYSRGGYLRFYLNGELTGSLIVPDLPLLDTGPTHLPSVGAYARCATPYGCRGFEGSIDDVVMYGRVLTHEEILQLYYDSSAPAVVSLLFPPDDAVIRSDSVMLFLWNGSLPDVDNYWFELSANPLFYNSEIDSLLTDTLTFVYDLQGDQTYWWRVRAHNEEGWGLFSETRTFRILLTSSQDETSKPEDFSLDQNYPNPFNPSTMISYALPERTRVTLEVFNVLGERVSLLVNQEQDAGWHEVLLDATGYSSGVFLYRLEAGSFVMTRKMLLVR